MLSRTKHCDIWGWPHSSSKAGAYRKAAYCLTAKKKVKNIPKIAAIEYVGSIVGPFQSITQEISSMKDMMKIMVALSTIILFGANISIVVFAIVVPYGILFSLSFSLPCCTSSPHSSAAPAAVLIPPNPPACCI